MRFTDPALALILMGSTGHASPMQSHPASSLHDLWEALGTCARHVEVGPEAAGSQLTILFTLKRDGNLQGKPRITYSRLIGAADDQRAFLSVTLSAIASCFPVAVTEGLGAAIAGRPIHFHLITGAHDA